MVSRIQRALSRSLLLVTFIGVPAGRSPTAGVSVAPPASPEIVLAGGCYWGVESVYRHVRGVQTAVSGFATPAATTGTAAAAPVEAVRIRYDSTQLAFRQILDIFFSVAHDPTQRDRQGPDEGAEYRSLVFVTDSHERRAVRAYIDSLRAAHVFARPIVTEIAALLSFQSVAPSQQDYAARNQTDPYIVRYDVPRLEALQRRFPKLYRK